MSSAILLCLSALVLGLLALPLGLAWAYWIALLALPLGGAGLLFLRAAERHLDVVAAGVIWLTFAASATARGSACAAAAVASPHLSSLVKSRTWPSTSEPCVIGSFCSSATAQPNRTGSGVRRTCS